MFNTTFTLEQVMDSFGMEEQYAKSLISAYDPRRVQYALDNKVDLCDLDRWEHLISITTGDHNGLVGVLNKVGFTDTASLFEDVKDFDKAMNIIAYLYEHEGDPILGDVPHEILDFELRLGY